MEAVDGGAPAVKQDAAVSMAAVASLTGWSERTVWRRLAVGTLVRSSPAAMRLLICWSSVEPYARVQCDAEAFGLLMRADQGDPQAQAEFALWLLLEKREARCAWYWLEQAAGLGDADAMFWLGRAYLAGEQVTRDPNLGLMWMARAASRGHLIASGIVDELLRRFLHVPALLQPA